jgi:hypothetical protein
MMSVAVWAKSPAFILNIKHSRPFDKIFQNLDKTVEDTKMIYKTIKEIPNTAEGRSDRL